MAFAHGRGMNDLSQVYKLPADREEMERLSLQHRIWLSMLGGLYPAEINSVVEEVLSGKNGEQPTVLDLGSGSGAWTIDMALKFPHARVLGIDLAADKIITRDVPMNCSFVKGDATNGLQDYSGKFNLIHTRSVLGHIEDVQSVIKDIYNCLRPGGLFILAEGNFRAFDENYRQLMAASEDDIDTTGRSWYLRFMEEMGLRMAAHNRKESAGEVADQWIQRTGLFGPVNIREYFSPIGWDGGDNTDEGRELGEISRRNCLAFIKSGRPNLLSNTTPDLADDLIAKASKELNDLSPKLFVKWNVAWTQRGAA